MPRHTPAIGCITLTLCLCVLGVRPAAAAVIPLTNDSAQTDAPAFGTTKTGPLDDPFAYDPGNPASPLPQQSYAVSPTDLWHSPNGQTNNKYSVLFDNLYDNIFVDFYARTDDPGAYTRDNNLTIFFYNGGWTAGELVHTQTGVNIDNAVVGSNRITIPTSIAADRFKIVNPTSSTNWSIAELRANGTPLPEPAAAALLLVGALATLRRRP